MDWLQWLGIVLIVIVFGWLGLALAKGAKIAPASSADLPSSSGTVAVEVAAERLDALMQRTVAVAEAQNRLNRDFSEDLKWLKVAVRQIHRLGSQAAESLSAIEETVKVMTEQLKQALSGVRDAVTDLSADIDATLAKSTADADALKSQLAEATAKIDELVAAGTVEEAEIADLRTALAAAQGTVDDSEAIAQLTTVRDSIASVDTKLTQAAAASTDTGAAAGSDASGGTQTVDPTTGQPVQTGTEPGTGEPVGTGPANQPTGPGVDPSTGEPVAPPAVPATDTNAPIKDPNVGV